MQFFSFPIDSVRKQQQWTQSQKGSLNKSSFWLNFSYLYLGSYKEKVSVFWTEILSQLRDEGIKSTSSFEKWLYLFDDQRKRKTMKQLITYSKNTSALGIPSVHQNYVLGPHLILRCRRGRWHWNPDLSALAGTVRLVIMAPGTAYAGFWPMFFVSVKVPVRQHSFFFSVSKFASQKISGNICWPVIVCCLLFWEFAIFAVGVAILYKNNSFSGWTTIPPLIFQKYFQYQSFHWAF